MGKAKVEDNNELKLEGTMSKAQSKDSNSRKLKKLKFNFYFCLTFDKL